METPLELGDRICHFLVQCGGAYHKLTPEIQFNVFHALGSQQYVLKEDADGIVYFASYWRVRPEDMVDVVDRIKPGDLKNGTVMYVSEAASRGGMADMAEIVRRLRDQAVGLHGLFWHRPGKKDAIYYFPSQRGREA